MWLAFLLFISSAETFERCVATLTRGDQRVSERLKLSAPEIGARIYYARLPDRFVHVIHNSGALIASDVPRTYFGFEFHPTYFVVGYYRTDVIGGLALDIGFSSPAAADFRDGKIKTEEDVYKWATHDGVVFDQTDPDGSARTEVRCD